MQMKIFEHLIRQYQRTSLYWQTVRSAKPYCTIIPSAADPHEYECKDDDTLTNRFTNAMKIGTKASIIAPSGVYEPRLKYSGFLRNRAWYLKKSEQILEESAKNKTIDSKASVNGKEASSRCIFWKKFCLLMAYSGSNYMGMQFNPNVPTIEDCLFRAMLKNQWITEENMKKPWTIAFQRGSRTDRGVSAASQCCSLLLPRTVDIDALNRELPDDIRVFGVRRVTPTFDSRKNCEARTYSYTLPTIAFGNYNDQTVMADYRLPAEQLQKVNDMLEIFVGQTNFHNYTVDKQHFDRSSIRKIHTIQCGEPFVLDDVEFARITVKGQSFMMHQIRKMIGLTLPVIRNIIPYEMLQRSLTKENFSIPTAPGLGLVLERLHFDKYDRTFGQLHGEPVWKEYDTEIEQFRRKHIDPIIIQTEIKEEIMVNWLDFLLNHSYVGSPITEETFDDSWGEDPEFWKNIKK